jgi:hypothetical protein
MIGNFPTKKNYASGGIKNFLFAPAITVTSFPTVVSGSAIAELAFKTGFAFLSGYSTAGLLQLTEDGNENEQGVFYDQQLQGFAPIEGTEIVALFAEMAQMKFICAAKDFNGVRKLIGTVANPLTFSYKYSSGLLRTDAKGYKFSFSRTASEPAPIYPF